LIFRAVGDPGLVWCRNTTGWISATDNSRRQR